MPLIRIDYDNERLTQEDIKNISAASQEIVSRITGIEDVFVYANSSEIKIKIAPIEIFIEMSAHKIQDSEKLFADIKLEISKWKGTVGFHHPINLTLIPMNWHIEIGI